MRQWYYAVGETINGPINETELIKLFSDESLPPQTLVWTEDMKKWQEATSFRELIPAEEISSSQYNPDVINTSENDLEREPLSKPSVSQLRPFNRFWARIIDDFLFQTILTIIYIIIVPSVMMFNWMILAMIFKALFVFCEAFMISTWSSTPGKFLFNIQVRMHNGLKLTYGQALSRSINVWIRGEALGIPFVLFITRLMAYNKLITIGATSWDMAGGYNVIHNKIGIIRIMAISMILIVLFLLIFISRARVQPGIFFL